MMATATKKTLKIKPIRDRILIRRVEAEETQKGGIFIPDSAREKSQEAKVIALGTGNRDKDGNVIPFTVKVGDRVLLSKYGGTEARIGDDEYLLVREDDVLAILG